MTLEERFDQFQDEFLKFERIENPPNKRRDICAFLMLDKYATDSGNIIEAADHDVIFLNFDESVLDSVHDDVIIYLRRCGVRYGSYGLEMFS